MYTVGQRVMFRRRGVALTGRVHVMLHRGTYLPGSGRRIRGTESVFQVRADDGRTLFVDSWQMLPVLEGVEDAK